MIFINDDNKEILKQAIRSNQPLNNFDTSNVTNMEYMFYWTTSFNQSLDNFDTGNVTDMCYMFYGATMFNQPLDNFDTSNVNDMGGMFCRAESFNQPLDNFNTSKVTTMRSMFCRAESFNQPLDNFDTSNVIEMRSMFDGATSMFTGYIMRFVSKSILVYNKYKAMDMNNYQFSNSRKLDQYIRHLNNINCKGINQAKFDSALDGFIVD